MDIFFEHISILIYKLQERHTSSHMAKENTSEMRGIHCVRVMFTLQSSANMRERHVIQGYG